MSKAGLRVVFFAPALRFEIFTDGTFASRTASCRTAVEKIPRNTVAKVPRALTDVLVGFGAGLLIVLMPLLC